MMKFYLPTLKHLVIQLAKLQIYTLNLTTTFWHSKKKSHYFWTGVYKQSQTSPDHWLERVSLHHQFYSTSSILLNWVSPFQSWQIFDASIKTMGVWSIVLYQDFPKVTPNATLGSCSHGNLKQGAICGVTEPTLGAASVATHQLKNVTAPIMTWWLSDLSFSVNTVLSAQHHHVCNKTNDKLSTLGSVSS